RKGCEGFAERTAAFGDALRESLALGLLPANRRGGTGEPRLAVQPATHFAWRKRLDAERLPQGVPALQHRFLRLLSRFASRFGFAQPLPAGLLVGEQARLAAHFLRFAPQPVDQFVRF